MSGPFSPSTSIPDPDAPPAAASVIDCGPFWPALDLADLRQAVRIDGVVTPERLVQLARNAVLDIMTELNDWRLDQMAAGHDALSDVPGRAMVDGLSDYEIRWTRAVHSVIAADVADRQLSQTVRAAGAERAEELAADIDAHRRNVTYAVRDFLGQPRIIAEVI